MQNGINGTLADKVSLKTFQNMTIGMLATKNNHKIDCSRDNPRIEITIIIGSAFPKIIFFRNFSTTFMLKIIKTIKQTFSIRIYRLSRDKKTFKTHTKCIDTPINKE